MEIVQRGQDLVDPLEGSRLGRGAVPGNELLQVVTLDIIHDEVLALVLDGKVVGDAGEVGVAQWVQQAGLARELPLRRGGGHPVLLDGDGCAEAHVGAPVDGAHSALAQQGVDLVPVLQDLSGAQRHGLSPGTVPAPRLSLDGSMGLRSTERG